MRFYRRVATWLDCAPALAHIIGDSGDSGDSGDQPAVLSRIGADGPGAFGAE